MRAVILAAAFVGLSGVVTAAEEKFESKAGKFTVTFPAKPMTQTKKASTPEDADLEITLVEVDNGNGALAIIYSDLPPAAVKGKKASEILAGGEKGLVDNFGAKVTMSKEIEFGKQKLPAREITAEKVVGKMTLQLRITLVLNDNRLYQVFVVGSKAVVSGKEADNFFKTFEITK
jgi:hypothetical protein